MCFDSSFSGFDDLTLVIQNCFLNSFADIARLAIKWVIS